LRLRIRRDAELELLQAARWYNLQRDGLGNEFLEEVDLALADIAESPRHWPLSTDRHDAEIRRALLTRFPYAIPFMIVGDEIIVLAIAHMSRKPGYWIGRADSAN
jgi:hypothetical protein